MSLALTRRIKDLEEVVRKLDERVLLLEMQKRPVEAVGIPTEFSIDSVTSTPFLEKARKTITLRGKAA